MRRYNSVSEVASGAGVSASATRGSDAELANDNIKNQRTIAGGVTGISKQEGAGAECP